MGGWGELYPVVIWICLLVFPFVNVYCFGDRKFSLHSNKYMTSSFTLQPNRYSAAHFSVISAM